MLIFLSIGERALFSLNVWEIGETQQFTQHPADEHRQERVQESDRLRPRVRAAASPYFFRRPRLGSNHPQGLLGGRREPRKSAETPRVE